MSRGAMRRPGRWLPLLIFLPLWGAGLVLVWDAERVILSELRGKLMVGLLAHADYVRKGLRTQERYIQVFTDEAADALANGRLPVLDVAAISTHLPENVSCAIFDRQGRVVAHSGAPESLLAEMGRGLPEYPAIRITDATTDASGQASYNLFLPLITPEGAPVIHQTEAWVGSLGCNLSDILSEELATTRESLGLSGEVYLVSAKTRRLLTSSRFVPNVIGVLKVDTEGVRQALRLGRGSAVYPDYRGISVWGAFLYLPEYDWVLLAEVDEAEVLAPLIRLRTMMATSLGLISIMAWFAGWRYEQRLSDTMARLNEARGEAEEAGQRLHAMVESAMSGIIETDERGVIERANPAAGALSGWLSGALVGRNVTVLMKPSDAARHRAGLARYLETGRGTFIGRKAIEVMVVRKDGTQVPCEMVLSEYRLANGSRRLVSMLLDISARKRAENQAIRLNELSVVRYLLEGLTHAVQNPLFILSGRIDLLGQKVDLLNQEELRSDVAKALDAVKRLGSVLGHFSGIVTAGASGRRPCSMAEELEASLALFAEELGEQQVKLHVAIAPNLPPVLADPPALHQIFQALLRNAVEAMAVRGHGTLTLTATLVTGADEGEARGGAETRRPPLRPVPPSAGEGDWIEVRIQDDGPGIPPEHRARLFEPFFTTKPEGKAAGVGLWAVRTIVMALQGTVAYETEVGQGTTVIVRLPVAGAATRGRGEGKMLPSRGAGFQEV